MLLKGKVGPLHFVVNSYWLKPIVLILRRPFTCPNAFTLIVLSDHTATLVQEEFWWKRGLVEVEKTVLSL